MTIASPPGSDAVLAALRRVTEDMARGAPLAQVLSTLALEAESILPGTRCSVLLREGDRLRLGAAPSLPDDYNRAVDGLPIGPTAGSCGAAAHHGRRVVVRDVLEHPNWEAFREWARAAGFRACWSEPILGPDRGVLGTFGLYCPEPREPEPAELGFIGTMAQIAAVAIEHDRVESRRRYAERLLRQIIDLDPNCIFVKDREGRIVLANAAAAQIYGMSVEALVGTLHSQHHRDAAELERMLADDREVLESGRAKVSPEASFVDSEGRRRTLHITKIPLEMAGPNGSRGRAVLGVAVDITDRKRSEESLAESEERFRQLAESISEVFYLTDWSAKKVLYVSPAYEDVWGRSCQSLVDEPRSWSYDIHPEDRQRVVDAFLKLADSGGYDVEYRIVRADGSVRWIHDRAFPVFREGVPYRVAGISADITRRKQVELDLERALIELDARSKERVRSLQSELLLAEERERRRLAIDLHDGLNQLLALAQMKLGELRLAEGDARSGIVEVERIVREAEQAARSLTFQLSPPVLHDFGFEAAVQWMVADVRESFGLEVELLEEGEPADLEENVRILLYRAVRELLINVAKHAQASHARVHLARQGGQVAVSVEDDGVAFDPTQVTGRGIGLSSIRERLESLGGRMHIRSAPGAGTTVTLVSPTRLLADPIAREA
jgi:PAS domain S-box-containing protein